MGEVVVIGGTRGIGRELAAEVARRGGSVVTAGRNAERAAMAASEIVATLDGSQGTVRGIAADLANPAGLAEALKRIPEVDHLVLAGMVRDQNSLDNYDIGRALELVTVKVVGYTTARFRVRRLSIDDAP